jgi:hypothetical protein
VSGEDEDLGNLDMRRSGGGVEGYVGDVVARERLDASVEALGGSGVAVEADVGEVGLDEAGFKVGDADGRLVKIHAKTVAEGLDSGFGGAIGAAARVSDIASYGADIDDMAAASFDHAWDDETRHHEESLDVGVNHGEGVFEVALVLLVGTESEASVVDEDVDVTVGGGKRTNGFFDTGTIADIKGEQKDIGGEVSFKFLLKGLKFLNAAGVENEAMAGLGELACTSLAYAGGCAGDEGKGHG